MEPNSVESEGISALFVAALWGLFRTRFVDTTRHLGVHRFHFGSIGA